MFNMEPSRATSGEQRQIAMRSLLEMVRVGIAQGRFVASEDYDADAIAYHCWATVHGIASLQKELRWQTSILNTRPFSTACCWAIPWCGPVLQETAPA